MAHSLDIAPVLPSCIHFVFGQIEFVDVGSEKGEVSFGFTLSALASLEKLGNDHRCITFTELENGVLAAGKKGEKN